MNEELRKELLNFISNIASLAYRGNDAGVAEQEKLLSVWVEQKLIEAKLEELNEIPRNIVMNVKYGVIITVGDRIKELQEVK